jgi:hypothetical protein
MRIWLDFDSNINLTLSAVAIFEAGQSEASFSHVSPSKAAMCMALLSAAFTYICRLFRWGQAVGARLGPFESCLAWSFVSGIR